MPSKKDLNNKKEKSKSKKESPKKENPNKKKKPLGKEATLKQSKLFQKLITNIAFVKKSLVTQILGKDNFLRILNFNEDESLWFVDLDKELFLYNEKTKKLLYYGNILNNLKIKSSKDIPWNEGF